MPGIAQSELSKRQFSAFACLVIFLGERHVFCCVGARFGIMWLILPAPKNGEYRKQADYGT